jgi:hypothetical protein
LRPQLRQQWHPPTETALDVREVESGADLQRARIKRTSAPLQFAQLGQGVYGNHRLGTGVT